MYPDRLSFSAIPSERSPSARVANPAEGGSSFASLYAEALQEAQQEIATLGSNDPSDPADCSADQLTGILDLLSTFSSGAPAPSPSLCAGLNGPLGPLTAATTPSVTAPLGENCSIAPAAAMQYSSGIQPLENTSRPSGIARFISWLDRHAHPRSTHRCAASVREALEAAGVSTADRPGSGDAGDYGPFLLRHGARVIQSESYEPQPGDIAVFDKTESHPSGHVQVYDGGRWVSDFVQHTFSPYRNQQSTPPVTIYRIS